MAVTEKDIKLLIKLEKDKNLIKKYIKLGVSAVDAASEEGLL